jgi:tetratricopeptide (TPR) repeat protein
MIAKGSNRLRLLIIVLALALGMAFVLSGNTAFAQGPDPVELDARLSALEKTVDNLFNFIIIIPALAAVMVVVLELRTWLTERADRGLAYARENREADSAEAVNKVMSSVNELLAFQAEQAKQFTGLLKKYDPSRGVEAIFGQVKDLLSKLKRHNLRQYHPEILRLSTKMDNLEDLYALHDFEGSIGCNHVRGLAGLLECQIEATNRYFRTVNELLQKELEPKKPETTKGGKEDEEERIRDVYNEYTGPVSLYLRGIHLKNLAQFDESLECLELALKDWPMREYEIQTHIDIAEVVALKTQYEPDKKRTEAAFDAIKLVSDGGRSGIQTTGPQKRNLDDLRERLHLIEGNYAFKHKDWDEAIAVYEKGPLSHRDEKRPLPNQSNVFLSLSIGLARWNKGQINEAKQDLTRFYHLIVDTDRAMTHPEPRGRILLGGSAIIAAKLSGIDAYDWLLGHVLREIEDLRRRNPRTDYTFHIFSPLTKEMHSLGEFRSHIDNPREFIAGS